MVLLIQLVPLYVLTLISASVQVNDTTESFILHFFSPKIVSTVIYTARGQALSR